MIQKFSFPHRILWFILLGVGLLWIIQPSANVQAHGGVLIGDGFADHYEWLLVINPYPITVGDAVLTLLVYDAQTQDPISELQAELTLARPGSGHACCQPGVDAGPFALTIGAGQYATDHSTVIPLNAVGRWEGKLHVTTRDTIFEIPVKLDVIGNNGINASATMSESVGQMVSPLTTPSNGAASATSSLTALSTPASPFAQHSWLWALVAFAPVLAVFVWGLRPLPAK